ncbi:cytochrome c553 [Shewanella psychrophila]|uniref:Cytochrome c553 n=1 Tax=Shewanella psychrophila TaxID=225848 RepID=A0A1S6HQ99_9GAMM|nr:cytochrome c [Shewanella psychrophila]AQS37689.1 cytochrome c553 [Shewanella psychrophila]
MTMMKSSILLLAGLLLSGAALANTPQDNDAFNATLAVSGLKLDTEVLAHEADFSRGEALANQRCIACHGETMLKIMPTYPSLKGQKSAYLFKQLMEFKRGVRNNPLMQAQAGMLSETEMKDVAYYYSQQSPVIIK